ncbi:hypothetical protein [Tenacibaculum agarivorans]|uniref:hypothetical protein n=1 Tax=Tenacibaculum agarivorans TaxID=1908389 RepID=UPI00094B9916|nr:hypothetical protein [Tenacibaculum agarivorans]
MTIKDKKLALAIQSEFAEYTSVLTQLRGCSDSSLCRGYYARLKTLAKEILEIVKGLCNDDNTKQCNTLLHELSWLSVEDYTYNLNIPSQSAIQEDYNATVEAINKVAAPIWRPNTKYHVAFTVQDIVDDTDNPKEFKYHYGFKTAGTVGHYHNAPDVNYGGERDGDGKLLNPEQYPLTSLEQYIDYKRSYPNADGNLLRSKPLFFGHEHAKLQLFYIKPYVTHMFKDSWDAYGGSGNNTLPVIETKNGDDRLQSFKVFVQDPVSNVVVEYPMPPDVDTTNIPETIEEWSIDDNVPMPLMLQYIKNFVEAQGGNCDFIPGDIISPASEYTTIAFKNLKPNKMYTAIITNAFNGVRKQVHNYVFQTSRYVSFEEQVNSYILDEENNTKAIFTIDLDISASAIDKAYDTLIATSSTNDIQETEFLDYLDRILEGTFKMKPLDPPETTEFNIIRNKNTNDAIALLIRNPEPFNDPKTPLEEMENTIAVVSEGSEQPDDAYTVLYAKDYSQAFIMHNSKKIEADTLNIRFQYKLWNGNTYEIVDQGGIVLVNDIEIK